MLFMKRLLSFLMAASLLVGFTACSDSDPEPTWDPKQPDTGYATDPGKEPQVMTEPGQKSEPITFVPTTNWTIAVDQIPGTKARASRADVDDVDYFRLEEGSTGKRAKTFSGNPTPNELTFYLVAVEIPEDGAGVQANVTLTANNKTDIVYKAVAGDPNDKPEFVAYAAKVREEIGDEQDPFEKTADGEYLYNQLVTTDPVALVTSAAGEFYPQMRFLVEAGAAWVITEKPFWLSINPQEGEEGSTKLFALAMDEEVSPIAPETGDIVFTVNSEAADAVEMGRITVQFEGCGNMIEMGYRMFSETVLFSAAEHTLYNENSGWVSLDDIPCTVRAPYGSRIFFASQDNWLDFAEELKWETEVNANGIDPTKYGLQTVGGTLYCDYGTDESRKAYLIGIPAAQMTEALANLSAADVLTDKGEIKPEYADFVLFTALQKATASDSLVQWADEEDFVGTLYRPDFATLDPIRPAAQNDPRTVYFAKEWATAPVAFELHYKNFEGGMGMFALQVPDFDQIEYTDSRATGEGEGEIITWAKYESETPNSLLISLNYDLEADKWSDGVTIPAEIKTAEDWAEFPCFFVLKKDGVVVTWIMVTLEPQHYEATDLIAGAQTPIEGKGSVELYTLNSDEPGYDKAYAGVPQYKLEMIGTSGVNFDKIPNCNYTVWGVEDEAEHPEYFQKQGTSFIVETPEEDYAVEFRVIFTTAAGTPVAVLYVDYTYGNPAPKYGSFEGATGTTQDGSEAAGTVKLSTLAEGDHGYDPDMAVPQYYLEVADTKTVQFEKFPAADDIWTDAPNGFEVMYQAGTLLFVTELSEAEFDIIFKKNYANIALMHVHYTDANGQGSTDKPNVPFALDESSIAKGASLRETTREDAWFKNPGYDAIQYTLTLNNEEDGVTFLSFPKIYGDLVLMDKSANYNFFEVLYQTEQQTAVALLGDAWGEATSAEYTVGIYDSYEDVPVYYLHVRYNVEGGSDTPGTETPAGWFTLDESSAEHITVRAASEELDGTETWYQRAVTGSPDAEIFVLTAKGNEQVTFLSFPYAEALSADGKWDTTPVVDPADKGYFEILYQTGEGKMASVSLLGDAYGDDSAEYTVRFYDPQWAEVYVILHVVYTK